MELRACHILLQHGKGGLMGMTAEIEKLKGLIDKSNNIVFFGGAGVSTESGIPDFRSKDGLYNQKYKKPPEYMLSADCLRKEPDEFWEFYRDKILIDGIEPNDAHKVLVELEKRGKLLGIITQNIDNLHEMAGSKVVYHIHGTIMTYHCNECGRKYTLDYIKNTSGTPRCECSRVIMPDVTLYGDSLPKLAWNCSEKILDCADLLIIAGTSLTVYPACNLVDVYRGKELVVINRGKPDKVVHENLYINDSIGEVLKQVI